MDEHNLQIVRESFDLLEPIAPKVAVRFHARLCALDPAAGPLLGGAGAAYAEQLMQTIGLALAQLDDPHALAPVLDRLGRLQAARGLGEAHCASLRGALISTLAQSLGAAFNADVEAAWLDAFDWVAAGMKARTGAMA